MSEYETLAKNINVLRRLQFEERHPALLGVDLFAGLSAFYIYQRLLALLKLYDSNSISFPGMKIIISRV